MANTEDIKSRLLALIETRRTRGLEGQAAIQAFAVEALTCLLECELARIEKREVDAS